MLIKTPRSTPRVLSLKSDCTLYILNDNYQEKKAPLSTAWNLSQQVYPFYAMPPSLKDPLDAVVEQQKRPDDDGRELYYRDVVS